MLASCGAAVEREKSDMLKSELEKLREVKVQIRVLSQVLAKEAANLTA